MACLLGREYDGDELDFTVQELITVIINQDIIFNIKFSVSTI